VGRALAPSVRLTVSLLFFGDAMKTCEKCLNQFQPLDPGRKVCVKCLKAPWKWRKEK